MTATTQNATLPYGCTTCGRVASEPSRYLVRGPAVVVQGVRLATCAMCIAPREEPDAGYCDGRCRGQYATEIGTYHEVRWRPSGSRRAPYKGWSCWDATCVDAWFERSWLFEDHGVEAAHVTIVDGKCLDE